MPPESHAGEPPINTQALPRGLARRMGYLLNRPAHLWRERVQDVLAPFGLLPPHFGVMATLESAYEPDQISAAKNCLAEWGVTRDEAITELQARGVID